MGHPAHGANGHFGGVGATRATLRALLDILSINMTRGEAKALIASSLNAFGE